MKLPIENVFKSLQEINQKPKPYAYYTTRELWCDPYISERMLETHLNENIDLASRKKDFIKRSVAWIVKHFKIDNNFRICDFGCGPGLYTTRFAKHGALVTGVDFSKTSIYHAKKIAKQENLNIEYFLEDYLKFTSDKKFNLICIIFCDFCALNPEQRKVLLKKFYDFLEDGGSILLDVSSLYHYNSVQEQGVYDHSLGNGFWSKDSHHVFHNTFKYEDEKLLLDKFTIVEETKIRESYNWLQCYSIQSITDEFAANGFEVTEHYSNVAGDPYTDKAPEIAVVTKKKAQGNRGL
jgi:SAM-dependent methyltransferase